MSRILVALGGQPTTRRTNYRPRPFMVQFIVSWPSLAILGGALLTPNLTQNAWTLRLIKEIFVFTSMRGHFINQVNRRTQENKKALAAETVEDEVL